MFFCWKSANCQRLKYEFAFKSKHLNSRTACIHMYSYIWTSFTTHVNIVLIIQYTVYFIAAARCCFTASHSQVSNQFHTSSMKAVATCQGCLCEDVKHLAGSIPFYTWTSIRNDSESTLSAHYEKRDCVVLALYLPNKVKGKYNNGPENIYTSSKWFWFYLLGPI